MRSIELSSGWNFPASDERSSASTSVSKSFHRWSDINVVSAECPARSGAYCFSYFVVVWQAESFLSERQTGRRGDLWKLICNRGKLWICMQVIRCCCFEEQQQLFYDCIRWRCRLFADCLLDEQFRCFRTGAIRFEFEGRKFLGDATAAAAATARTS